MCFISLNVHVYIKEFINRKNADVEIFNHNSNFV